MNTVVTLEREREADRAAIRALLGVLHVDPQIILIREKHAAAISRATGQEGA